MLLVEQLRSPCRDFLMPSVEPCGDKIRSFRRSFGFTQLELALRAGVSERTVRNAEQGRRIDHDFLGYIAGALGVAMSEVVVSSGEFNAHERWTKNCGTLLFGMQQSIQNQDPKPITEYFHPDFEIHQFASVRGVEGVQLVTGDYLGPDEYQRFVERAQQFWICNPDGTVAFDPPKGDADVVVVRGFHELRQQDGDVVWGEFRYVADFEGERLRSVVATLVPCVRPMQLQAMLTPDVGTNSLGPCRRKFAASEIPPLAGP